MGGIKSNQNLGFFTYDSKKVASAAAAGEQTLRDWNRQVVSKKCDYFINGVKLSDLRASIVKEKPDATLEFKDTEELKEFFKEFLFKDLEPEQAEIAATHALLQWHQWGILHATHQHTWNYALENFGNSIEISTPITNVYLANTVEGVLITEINAYREWSKVLPNGNLEKHKRTETEPHYAQTSTTYLFTPKSVELKALSIDCAEKDLSLLFDKQPEETTISYLTNRFFLALYAFIARFFTDYSPVANEEPEQDTQTSFKHPDLK